MGLMQRLHSISNRLGLIRVVTTDTTSDRAEDPPIVTRTVSLEALSAEIRTQEVQAMAEEPAEMSVPLEDVIRAAGVQTPSHGWNMQRLQGLLSTEQYRAMDRAAAQKGMLGVLAAEKVDVQDLVRDAVSRDKALDAFESFVRSKLDRRDQTRQQEVQQIRSEIAELEQRIRCIGDRSGVEQAQWRQWQNKKRAAEDELAWALSYLLEEPLITREVD